MLVPQAPVASPGMIAKVQSSVRVKESSAPRPVQTATAPPVQERPLSLEGDVVVIAPSMFEDPPPPTKLHESWDEYQRRLDEDRYIENLDRVNSWQSELYALQQRRQQKQVERAVAEPESVRPLQIRKNSSRLKDNTGRVGL